MVFLLVIRSYSANASLIKHKLPTEMQRKKDNDVQVTSCQEESFSPAAKKHVAYCSAWAESQIQ